MLISFFGPEGASEADVVGALAVGDADGLSDAPLELHAANISNISVKLTDRTDFHECFEILNSFIPLSNSYIYIKDI
jgi:thiamine pyrophosphokinase